MFPGGFYLVEFQPLTSRRHNIYSNSNLPIDRVPIGGDVASTQKEVLDALRRWREAEEIKEAVECAHEAAQAFDQLREQSALNLIAREPDLMLLVSAYMAGRKNVGGDS